MVRFYGLAFFLLLSSVYNKLYTEFLILINFFKINQKKKGLKYLPILNLLKKPFLNPNVDVVLMTAFVIYFLSAIYDVA